MKREKSKEQKHRAECKKPAQSANTRHLNDCDYKRATGKDMLTTQRDLSVLACTKHIQKQLL